MSIHVMIFPGISRDFLFIRLSAASALDFGMPLAGFPPAVKNSGYHWINYFCRRVQKTYAILPFMIATIIKTDGQYNSSIQAHLSAISMATCWGLGTSPTAHQRHWEKRLVLGPCKCCNSHFCSLKLWLEDYPRLLCKGLQVISPLLVGRTTVGSGQAVLSHILYIHLSAPMELKGARGSCSSLIELTCGVDRELHPTAQDPKKLAVVPVSSPSPTIVTLLISKRVSFCLFIQILNND